VKQERRWYYSAEPVATEDTGDNRPFVIPAASHRFPPTTRTTTATEDTEDDDRDADPSRGYFGPTQRDRGGPQTSAFQNSTEDDRPDERAAKTIWTPEMTPP
jgi:hypothetical protein